MGPKKNPLRCCANCSADFFDKPKIMNIQKRAIIQDIPIGTKTTARGTVLLQTMKVHKAVSTIYKLNYLNDLKFAADKYRGFPDTEDSEDGIALCENCSDVLENLVKYYMQFNELRKLGSYYWKKISRLDDLILRLETIVNLSDSQKQPEQQQVRNMDIKYDDDDRLNDDIDNEPLTNMVKCEFEVKEGRVLYSSSTQIDKNAIDPLAAAEDDDVQFLCEDTLKLKSTGIVPVNITNVQLPKTVKVILQRAPAATIEKVTAKRPPVVDNGSKPEAVHEKEESTTTRRTRNPPTTYISDDESDSSGHSEEEPEDESDSDFEAPEMETDEEEEQLDIKPSIRTSTSATSTRRMGQAQKKVRKPKKQHPSSWITASKIPDGTCPLCQKVFKVPINLGRHLMTHLEDKSVNSCPLHDCSTSFKNRPGLLEHLKRHAQVVARACPVPGCTKLCSGSEKREKHLKSHWREGKYCCDKCDHIFSTENLLKNHRSMEHPKSPPDCPACPEKRFATHCLLTEHVKNDHPGESLFMCTICHNTFRLKVQVAQHMERCHTDKIINCGKGCGRKFPSNKALKTHEDVCLGVPIFRCDLCSRLFKSKNGYSLHMKMHQSQEGEFKCTYPGCDKAYHRAYQLAFHKRNHANDRQFTCDQCGARFLSATVLRTHIKIHDQNKEQLCFHCGKSFLRLEGLRKHLRVHSDEKRYKCKVCSKDFKYSESLRLHFLSQHEKAKFVCSICGVGFPYGFSLKKHMSTTHHPEQDDNNYGDEEGEADCS